MMLIEKLYEFKKRILKNIKGFYKAYFTVEGSYTSLLPDKIYLKKLYKKRTGQELNLKNPVTFNEKLNWLKLYNRKPEYTMMVDKYRVREYIKGKIGEEYLVPLLGVYDKVEEIDFDALPNAFVLKCNHDSEVVICRDKKNNDFMCKKRSLNDIDDVKTFLKRRLEINFYKASREWPYKHIKRKIICEKYMSDGVNDTLTDYKFHCFNGSPQILYVLSAENGEKYLDYFDMGYNHLPIIHEVYPNLPANSSVQIPKNFKEMKDIAGQLSQSLPYSRVDLYNIQGNIYFGEITFFPTGGFANLNPSEWNYTFGEYIELPKKKRILR